MNCLGWMQATNIFGSRIGHVRSEITLDRHQPDNDLSIDRAFINWQPNGDGGMYTMKSRFDNITLRYARRSKLVR